MFSSSGVGHRVHFRGIRMLKNVIRTPYRRGEPSPTPNDKFIFAGEFANTILHVFQGTISEIKTCKTTEYLITIFLDTKFIIDCKIARRD